MLKDVCISFLCIELEGLGDSNVGEDCDVIQISDQKIMYVKNVDQLGRTQMI